jgi:hypothetical protein
MAEKTEMIDDACLVQVLEPSAVVATEDEGAAVEQEGEVAEQEGEVVEQEGVVVSADLHQGEGQIRPA